MHCLFVAIIIQEAEDEPPKAAASKATRQKKTGSKQQRGGGISKSKSVESDTNSLNDEDTAPLLLN